MDLTKPFGEEWRDRFDMVTNFGTTEHVTDQYAVYSNIHFLTRTGGVMIHSVPMIGEYPGHCLYRYTRDFFQVVAKLNGYFPVVEELKYVVGSKKQIQILASAILVKKQNAPFLNRDTFEKEALLFTKKGEDAAKV